MQQGTRSGMLIMWHSCTGESVTMCLRFDSVYALLTMASISLVPCVFDEENRNEYCTLSALVFSSFPVFFR